MNVPVFSAGLLITSSLTIESMIGYNAMRYCSVMFLGLFLLSGCASPGTRIAGTLLGSDGKPMALGHVHLTGAVLHGAKAGPLPYEKDLMCVQVDTAGKFDFSFDQRGAFFLVMTGVGHRRLDIPLLLPRGSNIRIRARLGALALDPDTDQVEIAYNFENLNRGERNLLDKQSDGTFSKEIHSAQPDIRYRIPLNLVDWQGTSLIGATADGYELLPCGEYAAIIHTTNRSANIRIDPTVAARLPKDPDWHFNDPASLQARFVEKGARFEKWENQCDLDRLVYVASGKSSGSFSWNWKPAVDTLSSELHNERDEDIRDELVIELLEIATITPAAVDRESLNRYLGKVAPTSLVWVYHGSLALQTRQLHPQGVTFFNSMVDQFPSKEFRSYLVYSQALDAWLKRDSTTYERLLDRLSDGFGDTRAGQSEMPRLRPRIRVGTRLPQFSFVSLDDPTVVFNNETFRGKYLFVDFWTTTCVSCVGQMKELHEVYEKYHSMGFEILSISFDTSPQHVKHFRSTKWSMPWANTVIPSEQQPAIDRTFDVCTPKNIVVDPTGTILMVTDGAEESLDARISRFMKESYQ
jgi:peroxiredoxin